MVQSFLTMGPLVLLFKKSRVSSIKVLLPFNAPLKIYGVRVIVHVTVKVYFVHHIWNVILVIILSQCVCKSPTTNFVDSRKVHNYPSVSTLDCPIQFDWGEGVLQF